MVGLCAAAAVLAAVITVFLLFGGDDGPAPNPPYEVGFNNNAVTQGVADPEETASRLAQAGTDVDRVQIDWLTLEPRPGEYDFEPYDAIYAADLAAGVRPLFIFAYAPPWAAAEGPCVASSNCHLPPAPEHYDDAARTVAAIARRYPKARAIEVWNEPNTAYFWQPGADPAAYAELLGEIYREVKKVAPRLPVAGASTAASPADRPGYIEDQDFVAALYELGAAETMDALSVHLYAATSPVSAAVDSLEQIEAVQEEYGVDQPIWITETGYTTTGPAKVTPADQLQLLPELVAELGSHRTVEMVLLHTLFQAPRPPEDPETGFGIVAPGGDPLPVFCDLAERWGGAGC